MKLEVEQSTVKAKAPNISTFASVNVISPFFSHGLPQKNSIQPVSFSRIILKDSQMTIGETFIFTGGLSTSVNCKTDIICQAVKH